jgi:hypothetical protein
MDCPSCGSANPEAKKFCGDCGAPLPLRCTACGAEKLAQVFGVETGGERCRADEIAEHHCKLNRLRGV